MLLLLGLLMIPTALSLYWIWLYYYYTNSMHGIAKATMRSYITRSPNTSTVLPIILATIEKYGKLVQMHALFDFGVVISDSKILNYFMSSSKILKKTRYYNYLYNWLREGLLTSNSAKWRRRRKIITPAYHFEILHGFIDLFEKNSLILIQKLQGNGTVDIYPLISLCTLDIICETAMGTSVNAQSNKESNYVKSVKEMCRIVTERLLSYFERYDVWYMFSQNYRKEKKALRVLHYYTMNVILQRKKALYEQARMKQQSSELKKVPFLDLLLKSKENGQLLSNAAIREEVDTIMFRGHDTVSSAVCFALYLLANHNEVQEKVRAEQKLIFGDKLKTTTSYEDLQLMKYLEMVIKETLRLYPSVPFYGREIEEDVTMGENTILKKGLQIMFFVYGVHHDPDNFADPEKFDPERFSSENLHTIKPYSYLPFSAGSRNCIGQKFAMLEMKTIISHIIRNFKLSPTNPPHKLQLVSEVVLKSANGVVISFESIK